MWLNGELLLSTDNMFVPHRVAVRDRLRAGLNELLLCFHPALERARVIEAAHGKRHLWNGDSARLYVRKAQYHFGWDWGPVLMTSGPWLPIQRQRYRTRIDDVHCRQPHATEAGAGSRAGADALGRRALEGLARVAGPRGQAGGRCRCAGIERRRQPERR